MSSKRKLRRNKTKKPNRQPRDMLGRTVVSADGQPLTPAQVAVAHFQEASTFQQTIAEILQHAVNTAEGADEGSAREKKYYDEILPAITEFYAEARDYVFDRGCEMIEAIDPREQEDKVALVVPTMSDLAKLPDLTKGVGS